MPSFKHTLLGIGNICDADCCVVFTKEAVFVYNPQQQPIISCWRKTTGSKLWRISLNPDQVNLPDIPETSTTSNLQSFSAYDLPSVETLVKYSHAAAGFLVRDTWLKAIKNRNDASWPGLTYENAKKYYLSADETIKGHLLQSCQGFLSTQPNMQQQQHQQVPAVPITNDLHITVEPISKLYTDDTGRFPTTARSGNQYIMIALHTLTNAMIIRPDE